MNSNLTPVLLLVVSMGLFYTYINPQYAKLQELQAQETRYEEAVSHVKEIQTIRDTLLTKFNSFTDEEMHRLDTMLPDRVDNVKLVLDLDGIASRYGIDIRSVKVNRPQIDSIQDLGDGSQPTPYGTLKVMFTFEAGYEDFVNFIEDIEQSLRIIDVTAITLRPLIGGTYEFNVTIDTYWLK